MRSFLFALALPVVLGGLFVLGIPAFGRLALNDVALTRRFTRPLTAIECPAPADLTREAFLIEVQYLSHLPDELSLLDPSLAETLADAFARHPWVESVDGLRLDGSLALSFTTRRPTLAIPTPSGIRVVDRRGVLLPPSASAKGLPIYETSNALALPTPCAGSSWPDRSVVAAAATLDFLRPLGEQLQLARVMTTSEGVLFLTPAGSRLVWGQAPGEEKSGELAATRKRDYLSHYHGLHGSLDQPVGPYEHDLSRSGTQARSLVVREQDEPRSEKQLRILCSPGKQRR
jgi:hypothetical protein